VTAVALDSRVDDAATDPTRSLEERSELLAETWGTAKVGR
jgi:hypothetical protein